MTTRILLPDHDAAVSLAQAIEAAGQEVALITERDEGHESYLVATPAAPEELGDLVPRGAQVTIG
ncbi:hypothetical protein [Propionibacterium sp.]|uniref:hypothetical protein n=1 Tax=Propionibacterium sp. TaxID=1977903 RepID=UPI0039E77DFD